MQIKLKLAVSSELHFMEFYKFVLSEQEFSCEILDP